MSKEGLGICVVGAGGMGRAHSRAWHTLENTHLMAVADVDGERARKLAEEFGFDQWALDFRAVVARDDVDVVSVCTPAFYHPEVTIFAAQNKKHILCEKPIALTIEGADRMIEAAKLNGVMLAIGFQSRYTKKSEAIAELIQGGKIGRPVMISEHSAASIRPKRAMHDMQGNAGPVVDNCCHSFDFWRMALNAEPAEVTARGLTLAKGRPEVEGIQELAPDTAALIVEHDSGDIGTITITWGLPPGTRGQGYRDMAGPKGVLLYSGEELVLIKEGGEEERIGFPDEDAIQEEIRHFAQTVKGEAKPKVTGEDGRIALQVSLAALKSMETGKPVKIGE